MIFARNTPPGVDWPEPDSRQGGLGQVVKDGRFWRVTPVTMFVSGTMLGFQGLWAAPYLFDNYGLSDIEGGNILLLIGIGATTGFLISGWIADRFGLTRVVLLGTGLFTLCQYILATTPSLVIVSVLFFFFGFSGAFNILLLSHVRRIFPDAITGQAITAVNLFGFAGTFLIQWLMGVIIGRFVIDGVTSYPPAAYTTVLLVTAVCNTIALTIYFPLVRTES